jgi:hypothetical protein
MSARTPVSRTPATYSVVSGICSWTASWSQSGCSFPAVCAASSSTSGRGAREELRGGFGAVPAEPLDFGADPDQVAEAGGFGDALGVVRGVRDGGDEGGEFVDAFAAADVVEVPVGLELVGERDRVDGFAARVERDRGAVDAGVRVAVEVGGVEAVFVEGGEQLVGLVGEQDRARRGSTLRLRGSQCGGERRRVRHTRPAVALTPCAG